MLYWKDIKIPNVSYFYYLFVLKQYSIYYNGYFTISANLRALKCEETVKLANVNS